MEDLNYLLAVIICFIGIYAGFYIALIAKEELKPGRKYFEIAQKALLAIAIVATIFIIDNVYISLVLLGILIYFIFIGRHKAKDILVYIILGVLLFLNSKYDNLFLMQSALVFLYGLPTGSLLTLKMIRKRKSKIAVNIFKRYIWFVIVALVLFLAF